MNRSIHPFGARPWPPSSCLSRRSALSAMVRPPAHVRHVPSSSVLARKLRVFDAAFGPGSSAPYLSQTLTQQGQLLRQY
jgi:hypothetical protein